MQSEGLRGGKVDAVVLHSVSGLLCASATAFHHEIGIPRVLHGREHVAEPAAVDHPVVGENDGIAVVRLRSAAVGVVAQFLGCLLAPPLALFEVASLPQDGAEDGRVGREIARLRGVAAECAVDQHTVILTAPAVEVLLVGDGAAIP
eukprot:SAG31_NODE_2077_length_6501_cov_2.482037_4_plen_147_part_00